MAGITLPARPREVNGLKTWPAYDVPVLAGRTPPKMAEKGSLEWPVPSANAAELPTTNRAIAREGICRATCQNRVRVMVESPKRMANHRPKPVKVGQKQSKAGQELDSVRMAIIGGLTIGTFGILPLINRNSPN